MNKNICVLLTNIFLFSLTHCSDDKNKQLDLINKNDNQPMLFKRTDLTHDIEKLVHDVSIGTDMISMFGMAAPFLSNIFNIVGIIDMLEKGTFSQGGIFASVVTGLNFISCSISLKRGVENCKKTSRILEFIRNLTKDKQNQTFLTTENAQHLQTEIMKKLNEEYGKKNIGKILFDNIPLFSSLSSFLIPIRVPGFSNFINISLFFNTAMMPLSLLFYTMAAGGDILENTCCDKKQKIKKFEENLQYLLKQYQMNGTV